MTRRYFPRACSVPAFRAAARSSACCWRITKPKGNGMPWCIPVRNCGQAREWSFAGAGMCFTERYSSVTTTAAARYASGRRAIRQSKMRLTTSVTCHCHPISSAATRPPIAVVIRRSMRAAGVVRRRRRGCTSRPTLTKRMRGASSAFDPVPRRPRHVPAGAVDRSRRTPSFRSDFRSARLRATALNTAKREKRRIVAVGTTTTRALEAAGRAGRGIITPQSAWTDLFIYPGVTFGIVDALMTNFHLPRSSLLVLVCAFGGATIACRLSRGCCEAISLLQLRRRDADRLKHGVAPPDLQPEWRCVTRLSTPTSLQ